MGRLDNEGEIMPQAGSNLSTLGFLVGNSKNEEQWLVRKSEHGIQAEETQVVWFMQGFENKYPKISYISTWWVLFLYCRQATYFWLSALLYPT